MLPMRKPALLLVCLLCAFPAACGDNDHGGDDDGTSDGGPDGMGPDAMVCPAPAAGLVGGPCSQNTDCDSAVGAADGFCFFGTIGPNTYPAEGYCVIDDGTGTVCATDADCGQGAQCISSEGYRWCLPTCGCAGSDADVCPPNQACFDTFLFPLDKPSCVPGSATAQDGAACAGVYECNENSQCFNDFENPGGDCIGNGCTVGDDTTCHGGTCVALDDYPSAGTPVCFDECTTDADCRTVEGYQCFAPANGGAHYCRHPHVGDACTTAADCGGGTWTCLGTTDGFPDGYCTQTGCQTVHNIEGCTIFSLCETVGTQNACLDRCDNTVIPTTCRANYACVDIPQAEGGVCLPI